MSTTRKTAKLTAELQKDIENRIRKFIADSEQKGYATLDPKLPNGWHLEMSKPYGKFINLSVIHYGINKELWMSIVMSEKLYDKIECVANVIAYAITRCSTKELNDFCEYIAQHYLDDNSVLFMWKRGLK